jgi:hypothetical protein
MYAFMPHMLVALPAMTSAVAILNALGEYRAPLKLSSFEMREAASKGPRNRALAFVGSVPVVDVGSICVNAIRYGDAHLREDGEVK